MSYRNDVDALAARHDALAAEVAAKSRELDSTKQLLDEAKAKAKLPVLPNIRVASPCNADWNAMTGDERVRACAQCNKNVYNLSEMTRDEAEALIVSREGRLCVRYYQRTDGTILLKDCSVGITQRRKRRVIAAGAAALLAGGGLFMWSRSGGGAEPLSRITISEEPEPVLGRMQVSQETVPQLEVEAMQGQMMVKMGDVAVDPIEDR